MVSHVLWQTFDGSDLDSQLMGTTLLFIEQLMLPLVFDLQLEDAMLHTKLEIVYQAGHAVRWDTTGFVPTRVRSNQ